MEDPTNLSHVLGTPGTPVSAVVGQDDAAPSVQELLHQMKGHSILVANRGIPARRICRSIRERLGCRAIVTATDVDLSSPAISAADEVMLLGPKPTAYLDIQDIVARAKEGGITAIHPGWGFASENPEFSRLCQEAGIIFIGPDPQAMEVLGSKLKARALAKELGIPTVPGSDEAVDLETARELAKRMELPVLLKAEGGGGGRGIVIIRRREELDAAFQKAQVMAESSFGNPNLYVEQFLPQVHHIEIQTLADRYGNVLVFDERDCSLQRNHQKLLEITPSPWCGMTEDLRAQLKDYAKRIVQAAHYHTLATVEFLVTEEGRPYLIEVNTRLQVEHGITESRYGIDLVEQQIAVALGARLSLKAADLQPYHWSLQCRINLEDPQENFSPNSGLIHHYASPGGPGVRIDSNLSSSYDFPSNYDSAGSLLICYAYNWEKLISLSARALGEYRISGLKTTLPFYRKVIRSAYFASGNFTTRFLEEHSELLDYHDLEPEGLRLGRLVAEISALGYNPHIKLGKYRSHTTPRLARSPYELPPLPTQQGSHYPQRDRRALLARVRGGGIHFSDTTCRDITQSNSGNRMRLAEDRIVGPYLDQCGFFSLETGGGAHFHMNIRANMTSPLWEAAQWRQIAPRTLQQVLVRSTNLLGYKPQARNVMQQMGQKLCELYDIIRCFDFLNCAENMEPLAEVILQREDVVFEPAISLSVVGDHYSVTHYVGVAERIIAMVQHAGNWQSETEAVQSIILGLKDMAGVCSPQFIRELVGALKERWPDLVLHYHRHATDGLFVPALTAAAQAGAEILDVAMGAAARWYGQGDVAPVEASLAALLPGFRSPLQESALRNANFVLKQIMPYLDRYCAPHFQGYDYDVLRHGMPGGAISSSQEGAMQQGYIFLLPDILEYLATIRQIVLYHDVTPGAQITWNNAFLRITSAYKQGGKEEVQRILELAKRCVAGSLSPSSPSPSSKEEQERLLLFRDANDAFKSLLKGEFGPLPLGFPQPWVYHSTFGRAEGQALWERVQKGVAPALSALTDVDLAHERQQLEEQLHRHPSEEEFLLYLMHPADTLALLRFSDHYGNANCLPLAVWLEGLEVGESLAFTDSKGKLQQLKLLELGETSAAGVCVVRFQLNHELMSVDVQVDESKLQSQGARLQADPANPFHIGAVCSGDLWIVHVSEGERVQAGQELCNISIMKQEKGLFAPRDAVVKKVYLHANFQKTNLMLSVREGDLILELDELGTLCPSCGEVLGDNGRARFCPFCGAQLS